MDYVIIGCCHAGTVAAEAIMHHCKECHVTIIEKSSTVAFLSCGIALAIERISQSLEEMFYNSAENLKNQGCTVYTKCEALSVDFINNVVNCSAEDGSKFAVHYDKLLITSGSVPRIPVYGSPVDYKRVFLCKSYDDAKRLIHIESSKSTHVAILGAGYIGIELAEAFKEREFTVCLIEREDHILSNYFCVEIADKLTHRIVNSGVKLMLKASVKKISVDDDLVKLSFEEQTIEADYCIICAGFKPNTGMFIASAEKCGQSLEICNNGAILVNQRQETSIADVYAAGDACSHMSMLTSKIEYVPLATTAVKEGIIAGSNMVGVPLEFPGQLGTSVLRVFGLQVGMTGVSNIDGKSELSSIDMQDNWRPEFIPNNQKTVRLIINYYVDTREIVGSEIMSEADVMQMINILSLAIQNRMTLDELMLSDFFFNPWYGKPLHIIQAAIAGRYYEEKFNKGG